jgi:hypothetical protein
MVEPPTQRSKSRLKYRDLSKQIQTDALPPIAALHTL